MIYKILYKLLSKIIHAVLKIFILKINKIIMYLSLLSYIFEMEYSYKWFINDLKLNNLI